jgi:hypothetical protein
MPATSKPKLPICGRSAVAGATGPTAALSTIAVCSATSDGVTEVVEQAVRNVEAASRTSVVRMITPWAGACRRR